MTTMHLLLTAWVADPFALAVALAALLGWGVGIRRGSAPRAGYVVAALAVFLLALISPIGVLARGYLFSAHMLQHLLLLLVVPPLALLALPAARIPTVLPPTPALPAPPAKAGRELLAWLAGAGAMWLWHAPALCDAAGRILAVQRVQTLSLLAAGTAFWWPIFAPYARARLAPFAAILYLFTACIACTVLGVLVTFSPVQVCSIYMHPADTLGVLPLLRDRWGLGPAAD
ncbi:MAG TPA: cytochrome c oxidase assembly protein, partial [Polyangiaceae bacterium]|nr:cytochrome c oxidase assembly protein [Polyangiaceae bacterium]